MCLFVIDNLRKKLRVTAMKKKLTFLSVLLLMLAAGVLLVFWEHSLPAAPASVDAPLSVVFLDVGQGDAALVGFRGHWMLIDGGGRESSQKIYAVLKQRNITHLDMVIASHPHEDHIGGLSAAFQLADAERVLCPVETYNSKSFENLSRYAREKSTGITVPAPGDVYTLGEAKVEIVGMNDGPTENARSLLVKVTYKNVSFLLPGDLEAEFVDPAWKLSSTVLKVSHHGSYNGTSKEQLCQVSPKYAVISLGAGNPYGMPHESTLNLLKEYCQNVYRTDLQGDITFTSDGNTLWVETTKTASTQKLFTPGSGQAAEETAAVRSDGYILNTSSKVFHLPSCTSTEKMKDSNKLYSSEPRESLISAGYKPCGNCKP